MYSLLDSGEDRTDVHPALSTQSGRVSFGVRGNAVWEWKTETGNFSCDINTQRLKKLQASELTIEQAEQTEQAERTKRSVDFSSAELSLVEDAKAESDFNPYAHVAGKSSPDPYQARVATAAPIKKETVASERKPIKDLKAYGEWLAMKKRLAETKDDDEVVIG